MLSVYKTINDKTWLLQAFFDFILIWFYYQNPKICSFLLQFKIDENLMFAILCFVNFILIRLFVLFLSLIIYILKNVN